MKSHATTVTMIWLTREVQYHGGLLPDRNVALLTRATLHAVYTGPCEISSFLLQRKYRYRRLYCKHSYVFFKSIVLTVSPCYSLIPIY